MKRKAFTIVELLVLIAIFVILVSLMMPVLRVSRSGPRRATCQNNLRQIALAMINFQSANQKFPSATGYRYSSPTGSSDQLSAFVQILPYMDEAETYDQIREGCKIQGTTYGPCPPLDTVGYEPWERQNPIFLCGDVPRNDTRFGVTHYGLCIGDRARNIASPSLLRGAFGGSLRVSIDDVGDGMSNTILAAEIGARSVGTKENRYAINQPDSILGSPADCFELIDSNGANWKFNKGVPLSAIGRGGHWADGRAGPALFNTILPPNSPSVSLRKIGADGIYSASGPHNGGLNIARMDGSITFIDSEIDAGDSSNPAPTEEEMAAAVPSPYGVWGALGTIDAGEIANEF